jgi:hypothetical protein
MGVSLLDAVFAAWLAASAIHQFDWKFWRPVSACDCFGLLPRWTFFAPRPGTDDVRLVYRDVLDGGAHTGWSELDTLPARDGLARMFWNPGKLDSKAVFDLVQMLAAEVEPSRPFPRAVLISVPYLQILDSVMQPPRAPGATARQFALLQTRGHVPPRQPTVLLLSQPHTFGLA